MSENLTDRDWADIVHALRQLAETNRQAARDALSGSVHRTGLQSGPTARSVALRLRRQATRYEALLDKIPVKADPAVIAEIRTRVEQELAECRAGWAEDGDKVLDRLFARPRSGRRRALPGRRVPAAQGTLTTELRAAEPT